MTPLRAVLMLLGVADVPWTFSLGVSDCAQQSFKLTCILREVGTSWQPCNRDRKGLKKHQTWRASCNVLGLTSTALQRC